MSGLQPRPPPGLSTTPAPPITLRASAPLCIGRSPRICSTPTWPDDTPPQLTLTAGDQLPASVKLSLVQENRLTPPEEAFKFVSGKLQLRGGGQQGQLVVQCASTGDGWGRLHLVGDQQLTAAGVYDLELQYREYRPRLRARLPAEGEMQLQAVEQVSGSRLPRGIIIVKVTIRVPLAFTCLQPGLSCCGEHWLD